MSRTTITILAYSVFFIFFQLLFLENAIGLFGGLFHVTSNTHVFQGFVFILGISILTTNTSLFIAPSYSLLSGVWLTQFRGTRLFAYITIHYVSYLLTLTDFYIRKMWTIKYSSLFKLYFYKFIWLSSLATTITLFDLVVLVATMSPYLINTEDMVLLYVSLEGVLEQIIFYIHNINMNYKLPNILLDNKKPSISCVYKNSKISVRNFSTSKQLFQPIPGDNSDETNNPSQGNASNSNQNATDATIQEAKARIDDMQITYEHETSVLEHTNRDEYRWDLREELNGSTSEQAAERMQAEYDRIDNRTNEYLGGVEQQYAQIHGAIANSDTMDQETKDTESRNVAASHIAIQEETSQYVEEQRVNVAVAYDHSVHGKHWDVESDVSIDQVEAQAEIEAEAETEAQAIAEARAQKQAAVQAWTQTQAMDICSTDTSETGSADNINPQNEQDIPSGQDATNADNTAVRENTTSGSVSPARGSLLDDYADTSTEMPDYIGWDD